MTRFAGLALFAVGCIQAQRCHTNRCPTGVTPQDPRRVRALDVADKSVRVARFQQATVHSALQIMAAMGVREPADLSPHMLLRRGGDAVFRSYAELYVPPEPGELCAEPPEAWAADWERADPDRFTV